MSIHRPCSDDLLYDTDSIIVDIDDITIDGEPGSPAQDDEIRAWGEPILKDVPPDDDSYFDDDDVDDDFWDDIWDES